MTTHAICDACECVSHCSKNGCIPLTPIFRAPSVGCSGETEEALRRLLAAFPKGNEKEHDADCMCVYHEAVKALAASGGN